MLGRQSRRTAPIAVCGTITTLVVDSTVWIDYFNGVEYPQTDYLNNTLETTPILVGDLILAEVLQGFLQDADFEKAHRALGRFLQASLVGPSKALATIVLCVKKGSQFGK